MNSTDITISDIKFHDKLSEMPIKQLKTEITEDISNNYAIETLNIEKVLSCIHEGEVYKKFVMDKKMIALAQFIKDDQKLIPPIIRNIYNNTWTILDGEHRIGMFLHIGLTDAPFLIRKDQIKYIENLK